MQRWTDADGRPRLSPLLDWSTDDVWTYLGLCNAGVARDPRPLDEGCECPACTRFSRAYLRHLVNQQELLGHRLLTLHNLRFVLDLVAGARNAIERGELNAYKTAALERLGAASEVPWAT